MRTPAGTECPFFHADYFRGRNKQECRLIARNPASERWEPKLCTGCPVPRIARANACRNLVLEAQVEKTLLGLGRKIVVKATCTQTYAEVAQPEIGCGHCHENFEKLKNS